MLDDIRDGDSCVSGPVSDIGASDESDNEESESEMDETNLESVVVQPTDTIDPSVPSPHPPHCSSRRSSSIKIHKINVKRKRI